MNQKLLALLLAFFSFGLFHVNAQTVKVNGTVLDERNVPVIGVAITADNVKGGAVSDLDGKFVIELPNTKVKLNFSCLGYVDQTIELDGRTTLKVIMKESAEALDEVVVVGYGTQRKVSVTGAVAQVDSKELKMAPSGDVTSTLAGRLPGLVSKQSSGQPGSDGANLYVRGCGAGDGNPLVVIDGVPSDYFPNFSPDEIESVTILKDATAAAVYGVRAAAGVILVTTKRGTVQKPTVTFNTAFTFSQNTNFPEFLNGPDYAYWYNEAQRLDGVLEEDLRFSSSELDRISNPGPDEEVYGNTDWFGLLFKDFAPSYTNNISLSGGTERFKYFASIGAYNQNGIIDRTSYDRYNIRANFDAKVTDHVDVSLDLSGNISKTQEPGSSAGPGSYGSIFAQAMLSYPYLRPYTKDGMPVGSLNMEGNGNNNPIAARDLSGSNIHDKSMFQANASISYKVPFIKGLKLKFDGSYSKSFSTVKAWLHDYKLACWNQSTRAWTVQNGRIASKTSLIQRAYESGSYVVRPTIEYHGKFGKNDITGLFLYEYTRADYKNMSAGREDFPITDIMDLTYGSTVSDNIVKGGHSCEKRSGFVIRLNYSYADKYLLEITSRIDASTALPKHNRWGVFPGVSLGWRLSEETFFKEAMPWWDNFKIRASAGRLGSDRAISNTMTYFSIASLSDDPHVMFGKEPNKYLGISGPVNPDLKWELTDTYNVGIESSMWQGKLGVEFDVFYMKTTRTLAGQGGTYRPSLGGWFPGVVNYGSHDNRGIELVLSHDNRVGEFHYNIRGNMSWARNKILKIREDANVPDYMRLAGRPMGEYWGFVAEGLFQTEEEVATSAVYGPTLPGDIKLKDINNDGKITFEQDRVPIGRSSTPEMMFGLSFACDWKGIDFSFLLQGAAMFDVNLCGQYASLNGGYDNTFYTKPFYCDGNTPYYLVENSWRPDHRDAKYPRLGIQSRINGGKMSSWWVEDGSYVRLKSLQLGYSLPKKWMDAIGLQRIRIYFAGGNLLTFCGLKHFDPEMPNVNQGYYPQQRTYELGLNLTF